MTKIYNTPEVLHIQETDESGNKRIVKYYREDIIVQFVKWARSALEEIENKADRVDE